LPTAEERREIIQVHLRKRGYTHIEEKFDLDRLCAASRDFVGSEIEAAIRDAMYPAFLDDARELTTEDIVQAMGRMIPLAHSHREAIHSLRRWVENGLARNASHVTQRPPLPTANEDEPPPSPATNGPTISLTL
ncbi:MAG: hypothetical protein D6820_16305, partial [Lentisphaerae bacterium]